MAPQWGDGPQGSSLPGKAEAWWMDFLLPRDKDSASQGDIVALPLTLSKPLLHPQIWWDWGSGWVRSYRWPLWGLCSLRAFHSMLISFLLSRFPCSASSKPLKRKQIPQDHFWGPTRKWGNRGEYLPVQLVLERAGGALRSSGGRRSVELRPGFGACFKKVTGKMGACWSLGQLRECPWHITSQARFNQKCPWPSLSLPGHCAKGIPYDLSP